MGKTYSGQDFASGSIFGKLVRFMIPVLGALILQAMYGAVDLLIIGRFGSNAGISGVSTGSSILNTVTFVVTSLASGVTIVVSHSIGANKRDRAAQVIGSGVAFFAVLSEI